jgi:hypothetical protein
VDQVRTSCGSPKKAFVNPPQGLGERLMLLVVAQAAAGHILDQAVDGKVGGIGGASDQRVGLQIRQRIAEVKIGFRNARDGKLQQRFGYRLRREPGQPVQQAAGGFAELIERGLPGHRHALGILHQALVVPLQNLVVMAAPFFQVLGEGEAALGDIGSGLLQGERQSAQFLGQGSSLGVVVRGLASAGGGAFQQEGLSVVHREHIQFQRLDAPAPVRQAAGEKHMAAAQLGKKLFSRAG